VAEKARAKQKQIIQNNI